MFGPTTAPRRLNTIIMQTGELSFYHEWTSLPKKFHCIIGSAHDELQYFSKHEVSSCQRVSRWRKIVQRLLRLTITLAPYFIWVHEREYHYSLPERSRRSSKTQKSLFDNRGRAVQHHDRFGTGEIVFGGLVSTIATAPNLFDLKCSVWLCQFHKILRSWRRIVEKMHFFTLWKK